MTDKPKSPTLPVAKSTPGQKQAPDLSQTTPWTKRNESAFPNAKIKLEKEPDYE